MKIRLFLPLVLLVVLSSACTPSGREPVVSNLRMAYDEFGEDQATMFAPSDVIYAVADVKNAPLGTIVDAKWIAVDVEGEEPDLLFQEQSFEVEEDPFSGTIFFQLINDGDWPAGAYKVELYLDDALMQSVEFNVE
jgi:hypothetical protein